MGWWQRYLKWRQRNVTTLSLADDGFQLANAGRDFEVRWDEVVRIVTFKRDLATVDLVCLAFELPNNAVEIHEQMPGYDAVETAMARRFAIHPEWKLRVMFPAFATNIETLYDRRAAAVPA